MKTVEAIKYPELVVEKCPCGCGRYGIVGPNHAKTGYWGPQSASGAAASGSSGLVSKTIAGIIHDRNSMNYSQRSNANRALKSLYERSK